MRLLKCLLKSLVSHNAFAVQDIAHLDHPGMNRVRWKAQSGAIQPGQVSRLKSTKKQSYRWLSGSNMWHTSHFTGDPLGLRKTWSRASRLKIGVIAVFPMCSSGLPHLPMSSMIFHDFPMSPNVLKPEATEPWPRDPPEVFRNLLKTNRTNSFHCKMEIRNKKIKQH